MQSSPLFSVWVAIGKYGEMKLTKTEITKALNHLENYGWIVKTFNSNRYNMRGSKGFPDHALLHPGKKKLIFIEVKLGKDKLSPQQCEYLVALREVAEVIIFPNEKFDTLNKLLEYLFNK